MSNLKAGIDQTLENNCCGRRRTKKYERSSLRCHGYFNPI
jgi:hypothetical protein